MNGLADFENPYGRKIVCTWLSAARERFLKEPELQSRRIASACTQALDLLQPPQPMIISEEHSTIYLEKYISRSSKERITQHKFIEKPYRELGKIKNYA